MKQVKTLLAGLAIALVGTAAQATVQIQISGLDFTYNQATGKFCDIGGCVDAFTSTNLADSDTVITVTVLQNGTLLGLYTSNLFWDLRASIAAGTNPQTAATNLLISPSLVDLFDIYFGGNKLITNMTSGQATFSNAAVNVTGTGFSSFISQTLPFGLQANNPINWSFSSGTGNCTGAAGQQICTYAGTGELAWKEKVSEPATLALLGLGLLGLGIARRRRS